jgi:hypothetical protein
LNSILEAVATMPEPESPSDLRMVRGLPVAERTMSLPSAEKPGVMVAAVRDQPANSNVFWAGGAGSGVSWAREAGVEEARSPRMRGRARRLMVIIGEEKGRPK